MLLDTVCIGAGDPDAARATYATLLETPGRVVGPGLYRFALAHGAVELHAGAPPGLYGLRFVAPARPATDLHGLAVEVVPGPVPGEAVTAVAIDHVVVHSRAPERAIATWRDMLGLRLALDREFPARGLRLLFFRTNHMTLEFACPLGPHAGDPGPDRLHGVSYRVPDLAARRERLVAAGCDVTEVRAGMKPGTRVATVRSGTAGVPTLLLEAPAG